MKAAIVLSADAKSLALQAGEIDAVLNPMAPAVSQLELWLFCRDGEPRWIPGMSRPFSGIRPIAAPHPLLPESCLRSLEHVFAREPADLLLFAGDGLGGELATRLAYRLKGSACLQVETCRIVDGKPEVTKTAYGNHLKARFLLERAPCCLSVARRPARPAPCTPTVARNAEPLVLDDAACPWRGTFSIVSERAESGLATAKRVLVIGQGVKTKETADRVHRIADRLGMALGATRPVVMNAWAAMDRLIGASGRVLSPELCIAAGVSGAPVFTVGIENSASIVAINTDGEAPIFDIADVGIVGDLLEVLTELEARVRAAESEDNPALP